MNEPTLASLFDGMAGTYDEDAYHVAVAEALVAGLGVTAPGLLLDVATGTGWAAFAALRPSPSRVLAVDFPPGMIARAEAKASTLDPDGLVTWRVGTAVPMPVADHSADAVLCASSLHFLGAAALRDWRRVLRPGGRVAFSLPDATSFRPSEAFRAHVPPDLPLPADERVAASVATGAGFAAVIARRRDTGGDRPRSTFVVHATAP